MRTARAPWQPLLHLLPALVAPLLWACTFQVPPVPPGQAPDGGARDLPAPVIVDAAEPDLRPAAPDPDRDGPRTVASFDLTVPIPGLFNDTDTTVYGPGEGAALAAEASPLVVLSPAVLVPRAEYAVYARRLASHGFLAVVQTPRNEIDTAQYRDNTRKLIDWLLAPTGNDAAKVRGRADPARIGLLGHGRGGKLSVLIAAADSRVKALCALDPVDNQEASTARGALPGLRLGGAPLLLVGETLSVGGGITCPQGGEDFQALYAVAPSPAQRVTIEGAGHHDFVDDRARCGGVCGACRAGTAPAGRTRDLAAKYAAAYFLLTLRGEASAAAYLSGAELQKDVIAGLVSSQTK